MCIRDSRYLARNRTERDATDLGVERTPRTSETASGRTVENRTGYYQHGLAGCGRIRFRYHRIDCTGMRHDAQVPHQHPVSYTHLDVYKRQASINAIGPCFISAAG